MKQNYTEYIVRVYHKRRESGKHLFLQWLRFCLKPYLAIRKVTVKKHKRLSEKRLIEIIEKEGFCCIKSDRVRGTEVLAKAIIKAQEGKR